MKIFTITCHDCYNCGASLQAYALQAFLEQEGHACTIIDYKPDYLNRKYNFTTLFPDHSHYGLYKKSGPLKPMLALYAHRKELSSYPRKRAFDRFTHKYLNVTSSTFHDAKEIEDAHLDADLFIAGSDQIWNTDLQNGRDGAFFMSFEKDKLKKISYAASFGISSVRDEYHDFVTRQLQDLRWVSVREYTGVQICQSMGINATQVLDPVFLLSCDQWRKLIMKRPLKENYLLLYYLGKPNELLKETTLKIAKSKGFKIVALDVGTKPDFTDVFVKNAGPLEFLAYLCNASFVISSSFHATAFSIIFGKQFLTFPLVGQRNFSRMKDLLDIFGIGDRFVSSFVSPETDIDYSEVKTLVEQHSASSRKQLLQHLNY